MSSNLTLRLNPFIGFFFIQQNGFYGEMVTHLIVDQAIMGSNPIKNPISNTPKGEKYE